ncbi:MAG TPA: hypothetical protein VMJ70_01160 [Candidatus Sulfotelmatobacter sp.]|nr:hypothetical protein [Candidatus Sulfotelmatobacter sp.]
MNKIRIGILSVALATLTAAGCPLISGQFLVKFNLPTPIDVTVAGGVGSANVDLNTISEYKDHKDNVKDLADFAVLADITNTTSPPAAIDVEVWITPTTTSYTTSAAVKGDASAKRVWGPFHLNAGQSATIDWDKSAALFTADGKNAIVTELKGDGIFTAYVLSNTSAATFQVKNGVFAIVIDAGQ